MRARDLLDNAAGSFGPEAMKVIGKAFDEAWSSIAGNFTSASEQGARLKLATIILSIANEDSRDVEALKNAAIKAMSRDAGGCVG
jgi:hypothetical protein